MASDTQGRSWLLTINNPVEKGFIDDDTLKKYIEDISGIKYAIFQLEKGEKEGTEHYQLFLNFNFGKRFSSVKKLFPTSHIEKMKGTKEQARAYCSKEESRIGQVVEVGEWTGTGERSDLKRLYEGIKEGKTNIELFEENASYITFEKHIESVREQLLYEKYKKIFRKLHVEYHWGKSETGKTRSIMECYGYENVYRVTDYKNPFDGYQGQEVILFEEFRSSLSIGNMLTYLEGYPLQLPCRYKNKTACFVTVYIVSNNSLWEQYENIQEEYPETWNAFIRRINEVVTFKSKDDFYFEDNSNYFIKHKFGRRIK